MPIKMRPPETDDSDAKNNLTPDADDDLTLYTEVDSGAQLTVIAASVTGSGIGSWNTNGLISAVKNFSPSNKQYIECKVQTDALAVDTVVCGLADVSALTVSGTDLCRVYFNNGDLRVFGAQNHDSTFSYAVDIEYTVRFFVIDQGIVITILGGAFDEPQTLGTTAIPATWDEAALFFQININNATPTTIVSDVHTGTVDLAGAESGGGGGGGIF